MFNFQGPAPLCLSTGDLFILPHPLLLVKLFFEAFRKLFCVLWAPRWALMYSTTLSSFCQPLFSTFWKFLGFSPWPLIPSEIPGPFLGNIPKNTKCCGQILDLALNNGMIDIVEQAAAGRLFHRTDAQGLFPIHKERLFRTVPGQRAGLP